MSAFGALSDRGRGHVVTAVLIAMVAMLCTAFSYGKMASVYPSAGSAFTYVAQEIHSSAGYITGWSMVMDYIVNPLICTIWCAGQAHEFAPGIPVWGWKVFFAVVFTLLNLQGIKTSARVNAGLAAAMSAVVVVVFVTAIPNEDTGYVYAAARTWAPLFSIVGFTLLVANFGSGMGAQIGAARLLYGMGRSNALPSSFFGQVDPKHHIPRNNVILIGAIVLVGSFFLTYGRGIELLNFGALIAFMGVNASAFVRYFVRAEQKKVMNFVSPSAGFFICLGLWWNLSQPAKIVGSIWMLAGIAFGVWKTRGFREQLSFEVPPE